MPIDLQIMLAPERLEEGTPEECAAFGMLAIRSAAASLTEGFDYHLKGLRAGPLVSGYHAAEWLAWNWWRLRWEPRSQVPGWRSAHCMASIGEGYVWPNLTIFSDGVRTALISEPSTRPDAKPFRYVGALPLIVPSTLWEGAVDAYVPQVVGLLREAGLDGTNLDRAWNDVLAERADPQLKEQRRLEAMLGRDPDEIEDGVVERLLADGDRLGREALGEIAADSARANGQGQGPLTAEQFEEVARQHGHGASPRACVKLAPGTDLPAGAHIPAWRVGVAAARALRAQQGLGEDVIDDRRLSELAGTSVNALTDLCFGGADLSFALDDGEADARLVLRSRWHTGRRFDLARLLGDRLLGARGALLPATRAYTYRQKAQRAFAAEFLAPFEAVDAMLAGDYDDEEHRHEVADHFIVAPMAVDTLLMNHGRLQRDDPERDFDVAVA